MRLRRPGMRHGGAGFTLLEAIVGMMIFSVVGYALLVAVTTTRDSRRVVMALAEQNRALRQTSRGLVEELGSSSEGSIVITANPGENTTLSLMVPIAEDGTFGANYRGVPHADWRIVYKAQAEATGLTLVREIHDQDDAIVGSAPVIAGLRPGSEDPPGFRVVKEGEMWVLTISTVGDDRKPGTHEVFHARSRN